jgi:NADH:ubiquinone oxidoreductase subunit 6 (subunit J)
MMIEVKLKELKEKRKIKMKAKVISSLVALVSVFVLVACSSAPSKTSSKDTSFPDFASCKVVNDGYNCDVQLGG